MPLSDVNEKIMVFVRVTEGVYTGNRGYYYNIASLEERACGAVTEHIYLVVYHSVLLDVNVLTGNICLGLIVIVVGYEILYRIVREKRAKLGA